MFDNILKATSILAMMMCGNAIAQPAADPAVPENAQEQPALAESAEETVVTQMMDFFDGLDAAIGSDMSDCAHVADVLQSYYEDHIKWINNLSYATENASPQIIEQVRLKAAALGEKLSACYNEPRIPELLQKYGRGN